MRFNCTRGDWLAVWTNAHDPTPLRCSYFTVITAVGFYVMLDEPWFPPVLGGSGKMVNAFNAIEKPPSAALKWYYYVQFGYHIHSLIYMILLSPIRNDFIEMLLHHLATIMLIAWAYLSNYHAGGALVAITHDIGDVTGCTYLLAFVALNVLSCELI